ncbi:S9 family peptidase [Aliidiomarina indica]|uniref:S9 family peptidase n=1 Tax=Aliidiomarina indica TaxID=2749147 RepID=UPI0018900ABD|nr:S9 family peptidase [Aliidiomarina indica]
MKLKTTLLCSTGLLLGLSALPVAAEEPRAITAEDYYDMVFLQDLTISPDGTYVAFIKSTVNDDKRGRDRTLWLSRNGEAPVQFTSHKGESAPLFAPDSQSMVFFSGRDNGSALYQISLTGGEAKSLLSLEQGSINNLQWHPSGNTLLLNVRVKPDVEDLREKSDNSETKPDITVVTQAVYKRQGGYLDESRSGLWLYNIAEDQLTSLTGQTDWNESNASYSPSGECIAFQSNRHEQAHDGAFHSRVYVRCDDDDNERELHSPEGWAGSPVWVNDEQLAFVHRADNYAAPSVFLIDHRSGSTQLIAETMDHGPSDLQYHQGALWFIADDRGSRPLFQLSLDGSGYQRVRGVGYSLSQLSTASNHTGLVWVEENEVTAPRIRIASDAQASAHTLTHFNDALVASLDLQPYEVFTAENERGDVLDVFFLPPLDQQDGQTYPLVLNIKGGPGGMWGHQWFPENQLLRARGYAVVFVNYRGSSGYGHDFAMQVRMDYGGADYRDNMHALAAALEQHLWIDTDRLYVTGGSHGGFLTNWITTQTNQFRAAVTQRSVSNWISEAGTQAFPPLSMKVEFGGTIWENYDYYWDRSPLKYADRVTTPTLIIHSTDDHITPIGQGEEWFFALKANDVPVEMVIFSGEGHGLSRAGRPINLVERLNRIIDWFDRHNP